jgi:hypothetical protein
MKKQRNGHCHRNGRTYPMSEAQRIQVKLKTLDFMEWRMEEQAAKLRLLISILKQEDEVKL